MGTEEQLMLFAWDFLRTQVMKAVPGCVNNTVMCVQYPPYRIDTMHLMTSMKLLTDLHAHNISVLLMLSKVILSTWLDASDEDAAVKTIDGIVSLFSDILEIELSDQN